MAKRWWHNSQSELINNGRMVAEVPGVNVSMTTWKIASEIIETIFSLTPVVDKEIFASCNRV